MIERGGASCLLDAHHQDLRNDRGQNLERFGLVSFCFLHRDGRAARKPCLRSVTAADNHSPSTIDMNRFTVRVPFPKRSNYGECSAKVSTKQASSSLLLFCC